MDVAKNNDRYTYADYINWDNDIRYELIDGIAHAMAPPSRRHQDISVALIRQISNFLEGKPCRVYHAPFGVRLNAAGNNDDTVIEPDIVVICDESKLDDKGCNGAPDMVIEILSPSTASRDKVLKFNKYLSAGVREYWIVDPESKSVSVNILDNGRYYTSAYGETDVAPVHVLDGCTIELSIIFTLI